MKINSIMNEIEKLREKVEELYYDNKIDYSEYCDIIEIADNIENEYTDVIEEAWTNDHS